MKKVTQEELDDMRLQYKFQPRPKNMEEFEKKTIYWIKLDDGKEVTHLDFGDWVRHSLEDIQKEAAGLVEVCGVDIDNISIIEYTFYEEKENHDDEEEEDELSFAGASP